MQSVWLRAAGAGGAAVITGSPDLFVLLRGVDQPLVVVIRFGRHAEVFPQLGVRPQFDLAFGCPGPCENSGICDGDLGLERSIARTAVALDSAHLVRMREAADPIPSVLGDP